MATEYAPYARETGASITDIRRTQRLDKDAGEITDWVLENIPWTVAIPEWPAFHERWPMLTEAELAKVESELCRRGTALDAPDTDLDAIAAKLKGRSTYWTAAADWLSLNPEASITDIEFFRLFGQLTRAELILAAIEHKRRILRRM